MKLGFKYYLIFGLFFFGVAINYTVMHESAHKEILYSYGCDSEIGFSLKEISATTTIIGDCPRNEDMVYLNAINDIVGYHLTVVWIALFYVGLLLAVAINEVGRHEVII